MAAKVIVVALECAGSSLIRAWSNEGLLPCLRKLIGQGVYYELEGLDYYHDEAAWTAFLTGCHPDKTGFWTPVSFDENSYDIASRVTYDFSEFPLFYSGHTSFKTAVFDLPHCTHLSPNVNGLQVAGWGGHYPLAPGISMPPGLFEELTNEYGKHPAMDLLPLGLSWWDTHFLTTLRQALLTGISRRFRIVTDLLKQEEWDLFLAVFAELHEACHHFWHLSRKDHLLHGITGGSSEDPVLTVYKAVDSTLGALLSEVDEDAYVLVFSLEQTHSNIDFIPGMLFLPELLYRFSFPGKRMFPDLGVGSVCPAPFQLGQARTWTSEIWNLRESRNVLSRIFSPFPESVATPWHEGGRKSAIQAIRSFAARSLPAALKSRLRRTLGYPRGPLAWHPTSWYESYWPRMKAFSLPSHDESCIRLNVRGREARGLVSPDDFGLLCAEIEGFLHELRDPRTGKPAVERVFRIRQSAKDMSPQLPDADLVVRWNEYVTDCVDSPSLGRVGPFPYLHSGGHSQGGFAIIRGPGITPSHSPRKGHILDLPSTILHLMGAPIPDYLDGDNLLRKS